MDFNTLIGMLGPDARDAVHSSTLETTGFRPTATNAPAPTPLTGTEDAGIAGIFGGRGESYDYTNNYQNLNQMRTSTTTKRRFSLICRHHPRPDPRLFKAIRAN